jgi:hypothetical protein
MTTELNADSYNHNASIYTIEFQRVLRGVFACYTMMLNDKVKLPNDENKIRDTILFAYLKNDYIRNTNRLTEYLFDGEVLEPTEGKIDIKVQTKQTFIKTEAYYIIECKRIDNKNLTGISGLNAKYIEDGICRFVSKHYSTNCGINAMIGFVVETMDIHANIEKNINALANSQFAKSNIIRNIRREFFIPDFEFHYSSIHKDINNKKFVLYHLMFDFSNNII